MNLIVNFTVGKEKQKIDFFGVETVEEAVENSEKILKSRFPLDARLVSVADMNTGAIYWTNRERKKVIEKSDKADEFKNYLQALFSAPIK